MELTPRPDHVPPELVYDFDLYSLRAEEEDVQAMWRGLRDRAPAAIFWTPRHGGHWVATRAEHVEDVQIDYERFSHRKMNIPMSDYQLANPALPLGADPPVSTPFRALIMPAFLPAAVNRLTGTVQSVASELAEQLAPRGGCEFMTEFARILPVVVFLSMVDLPLEDRPMLQALSEQLSRSGSREKRQQSQEKMREYLGGWIRKRTAEPGDDLISRICRAEINGRPITLDETQRVCSLLVFGGLDTVASMIGFAARHLAVNPHNRRKVRERLDDPARMRVIVEELIRRHALSNTAREITHDLVYKGVQLKKGEQILIPNVFAGLDEAKVERPLEVDFDREMPIYHATFGNGVHTCPGATLARREITVFLREWLSRIPDFEVKPGTHPLSVSGSTNTIVSLELVWEV
ncbi:MAG: cytochrome P450 [Caulobacteraceae bacterium]|nr:cytochrome P450 [Caulobacteraceae bacterium]